MKPKIIYRMRRKGTRRDGSMKYILEKIALGKIYTENVVLETRTVYKPAELWKLHSPTKSRVTPSYSSKESKSKAIQKGVQSLLNESKKSDIIPTPEEIEKSLRENGVLF